MDNLLEAFDRFMHLKKSTLKDGLKLYWAMLRASMFNGLVACILLSTMVMLSGMANGRTPPLSGGPIAWLGSALFVALFSNTLYLGALGIVRVCVELMSFRQKREGNDSKDQGDDDHNQEKAKVIGQPTGSSRPEIGL